LSVHGPRVAWLCSSLAACLLVIASCAGRRSAGAAPPLDDDQPRGSLVIVGGGPRPPEITNRFVELAGGAGRARVLVLPMASEDSTSGPESAAALRALGVDARSVILSRAEAERATSGRLLEGITAVWFPGGDQSRLTAALGGTPFEVALHRFYHGGGTIGGTSAGAAVMSQVMITGDERQPGGDRPPDDSSQAFMTIARDNIITAPGFGFLRTAIVDQHFVRRKRHNRLLTLVLEHPDLIGVGIDESTALEVEPSGCWRVFGTSVVVIYDARQAKASSGPTLGASDLRVSVLPSGSRYAPRGGAATLPGGPEPRASLCR
jgi:cyanophycinase